MSLSSSFLNSANLSANVSPADFSVDIPRSIIQEPDSDRFRIKAEDFLRTLDKNISDYAESAWFDISLQRIFYSYGYEPCERASAIIKDQKRSYFQLPHEARTNPAGLAFGLMQTFGHRFMAVDCLMRKDVLYRGGRHYQADMDVLFPHGNIPECFRIGSAGH